MQKPGQLLAVYGMSFGIIALGAVVALVLMLMGTGQQRQEAPYDDQPVDINVVKPKR